MKTVQNVLKREIFLVRNVNAIKDILIILWLIFAFLAIILALAVLMIVLAKHAKIFGEE